MMAASGSSSGSCPGASAARSSNSSTRAAGPGSASISISAQFGQKVSLGLGRECAGRLGRGGNHLAQAAFGYAPCPNSARRMRNHPARTCGCAAGGGTSAIRLVAPSSSSSEVVGRRRGRAAHDCTDPLQLGSNAFRIGMRRQDGAGTAIGASPPGRGAEAGPAARPERPVSEAPKAAGKSAASSESAQPGRIRPMCRQRWPMPWRRSRPARVQKRSSPVQRGRIGERRSQLRQVGQISQISGGGGVRQVGKISRMGCVRQVGKIRPPRDGAVLCRPAVPPASTGSVATTTSAAGGLATEGAGAGTVATVGAGFGRRGAQNDSRPVLMRLDPACNRTLGNPRQHLGVGVGGVAPK